VVLEDETAGFSKLGRIIAGAVRFDAVDEKPESVISQLCFDHSFE